MFKFDMHCHTKAGSIDSRIPITEYIDLLKEQGFAGMLVTDHTSYKGYRHWLKHHSKETKDFVVLKGVEYDTRDAGHFIVIMPDDVNLKLLHIRGMSLKQLEKVVHQHGGIYGPAHPFGPRSSSSMFCFTLRKNRDIINTFDFVEGFNTCEKEYANKIAQIMAEDYGLPCIAGSDSHKAKHVGTAYTSFDRPISCCNDLIEAIKSGGIIDFGGTEREFLPKHKKRHSFAATWGFKTYNRGLGILATPYRYHKVRKLGVPKDLSTMNVADMIRHRSNDILHRTYARKALHNLNDKRHHHDEDGLHDSGCEVQHDIARETSHVTAIAKDSNIKNDKK